MSRFENKKMLVTGGSSGIGLATAERLTKEGAKVMITGTNDSKLEAAKTKMPGLIIINNDAGDPNSAAALAEAVKTNFDGELHGIFLNAGFAHFHSILDVTAEEFDKIFAVNVRGPMLEARVLVPLLVEGGSVVFNTSVAREMGLPGSSIYASTKGALRTLTRVLAKELSSRKIRVNAVSPGPVGSDFMDRTGMSKEETDGFAQQILSSVPLGRFGEPAEIAAVVAFLLSADASFVTGAEYAVDGGMAQV